MFFKWVLSAVTVILAAFADSPVIAADAKPNFLLIYTDDQRWDAMGVVQREQEDKARYPWFKTPNMDRIAKEGMRFRNAFVTYPLCAPSRAAFLTGRYNHLNGVANNHSDFPPASETFATLLGDAGYATAYIGKWHMGRQSGKRPGFKYSASFVGQGRYMNCPFEINGITTNTVGWVDDVSTSYAIDFIRDHAKEPFALVLGYKTSHGPNQPPPRSAERFEGEEARPVPNLDSEAVYRNESKIDAPEKRRRRKAQNQGTKAKRSKKAAGGTVKVAKTNLNYFRTLSAIDDNLGHILDALDKLDLSTNTVVVFTSDNGYYHGEHGLSDKRSLYEESIRVPLLVRYPEAVAKGKVLNKLALNIDVAPTFLELAGVKIPAEMQGKSWVQLFTREGQPWRTSFLVEYFAERGFGSTPTTVGVRTEDAKLITYPGHEEWTELFDLRADPYETKNLWNHPEHSKMKEQMQAELDQQKKATEYVIPAYADKVEQD